jgi:O-antigen/teichoic acid export membrane protein
VNRIILNYLLNSLYQLFVLILPFITTPYIARVLGPKNLGMYAYSYSIVQFLFVFGMLGIQLYGTKQISIYSTYKRDTLTQEFWSIYLIQVIGMILSIVGFMVYSIHLSDAWTRIFLLQGINLLASVLDVSWLLMGLQRFKETVTRNLFVKIISIGLIFTFVRNQNDLPLYIIIVSISTLLGQLLLWVSALKFISIRPELRKLNLGKHLKPILILFLPQLIGQLYLSMDKVILKLFSNDVQVGYYDQAMRIVKLILALVTSIGAVMLPNISAEFSKGNHEKILYYVEKVLRFVLFITIPMSFGLFSISSNFVQWFLGARFISVAALIKIICPIIIFIGLGSLFGVQILAGTNQNKRLTLTISCGAIVSLIVSLAFVPKYGMYGTSIATLLAEVTVTSIQFLFVKKYVKIRPIINSLCKYIFSGVIMVIIILVMDQLKIHPFLKTLIEVSVGMLSYTLILLILKESFLLDIKKQMIRIYRSKRKNSIKKQSN